MTGQQGDRYSVLFTEDGCEEACKEHTQETEKTKDHTTRSDWPGSQSVL